MATEKMIALEYKETNSKKKINNKKRNESNDAIYSKSLHSKINEFNSKINELKRKKVEENRMKNPQFELKYQNLKNGISKLIDSKTKMRDSNSVDMNLNITKSESIIKTKNIQEINPIKKELDDQSKKLDTKENTDLKTKANLNDQFSILPRIGSLPNILPMVPEESHKKDEIDPNMIPSKNKESSSSLKIKTNKKSKSNNFTSLYTVLSQQTRSFFAGQKNKTLFINESPLGSINLNKKLNMMKRIQITNFLDRREKDEIPYVFPVAYLHQNEFKNLSEMNRFEKIKQILLNLKFIIENDEENEVKIVKEFLFKNSLLDEELYTIDKINNFLKFLRVDFSKLIKKNHNLKQVISEALMFEDEQINEDINKKNENTNSKIQNLPRKKRISQNQTSYDFSRCVREVDFNSKNKINTNNTKEVVEKLQNELYQSKLVLQKVPNHRKNSKNRESDEIDEGNREVEFYKKNSKLLELIMLQRSKTKVLLEENSFIFDRNKIV